MGRFSPRVPSGCGSTCGHPDLPCGLGVSPAQAPGGGFCWWTHLGSLCRPHHLRLSLENEGC